MKSMDLVGIVWRNSGWGWRVGKRWVDTAVEPQVTYWHLLVIHLKPVFAAIIILSAPAPVSLGRAVNWATISCVWRRPSYDRCCGSQPVGRLALTGRVLRHCVGRQLAPCRHRYGFFDNVLPRSGGSTQTMHPLALVFCFQLFRPGVRLQPVPGSTCRRCFSKAMLAAQPASHPATSQDFRICVSLSVFLHVEFSLRHSRNSTTFVWSDSGEVADHFVPLIGKRSCMSHEILGAYSALSISTKVWCRWDNKTMREPGGFSRIW